MCRSIDMIGPHSHEFLRRRSGNGRYLNLMHGCAFLRSKVTTARVYIQNATSSGLQDRRAGKDGYSGPGNFCRAVLFPGA